VLLFVLEGAIAYLPFMNQTFGTVPLGLSQWGYPFALGIAVFVLVEVEKGVMRLIDKHTEKNTNKHAESRG
jgi:hypothetical protein